MNDSYANDIYHINCRFKLVLENCMLVIAAQRVRGGDTRNAVENSVNDFYGSVVSEPYLFRRRKRLQIHV